jgi:hypothetical protein
MRLLSLIAFSLLFYSGNAGTLLAQVRAFPYTERFDSVTTPSLPPGWTTSTTRLMTGDFATTTSLPHSSPNTVISTNSTIPQYLASPRFDFSGRIPDKLEFWTSRSSTHTSGVIIEASTDSGLTFPIVVGDTLKNPGNTAYSLVTLNLPPSLGNQPQVEFRWRVLGGNGGTSGTLRIDDVSITVKTAIDLALQTMKVSPNSPVATDSLTFSLLLANIGTQTVSNYSLELFDDVNRDSIGQTSERLQLLFPSPISPADSLCLEVKTASLGSGDHQILCVLSIAGDENLSNNGAIVSLFISVLPHSVVINEIMCAPAGGEPEWIEIFNTSTAAVNLRNWRLSNRISSSKYVVATTDTVLLPKSFAVVTRDSLGFSTFHPSIPGLLLINSGLPIALFRNDSDAVVLYDPRNTIIDSLYYRSSWGGSGGKSLERISVADPSTERSNWGTSLNPAGSTPGRVNSITQKENDIAITSFSASPPFPTTSSSLTLSVKAANVGKQPASGYSVSFFEDTNEDSIGQANELLSHVTTTPTLQPGDSAIFSARAPNATVGDHHYLAAVEYPLDEENLNNTRGILVTVGLPPMAVVINEIMFAPDGGEPEWIEIFNTSDVPASVRNWKISNRISSTKYVIAATDATVPPRGFAVITRDSAALQAFHPSIPGLLFTNSSLPTALFRNDSDAVVLYDQRNSVIDSLYYRSSWGGGGGKSLERISPSGPSSDPSNWGTSLDLSGSTPGHTNTLTQKQNDLAVTSFSASPPSPTVNSTVTLIAKVKNVGTQCASGYSVSFFEDVNRDSVGEINELITRITSPPPLLAGDSTTLSAQTPNVQVGEHYFLAVIEYSLDEENLNNMRTIRVTVGLPPKAVVINEIMYGPNGGEPEWIEIYNASGIEVNLRNWRISNRFTSSKYVITSSTALLHCRDYAVITRDSLSFLAFHPSFQGVLFVNRNVPVSLFSNSGDGVVLFDSGDGQMDSLFYSPSWGGSEGRSLERVAPGRVSTDPSNWGTSLDPSGGSPGCVNTLAQKDNDLAINIVSIWPASPVAGGTITFTAVVQNAGTNPASSYTASFFEDANNDSVGQANELIACSNSTMVLQPGDSASFTAQISNVHAGMSVYLVTVDYSADEDPLNNTKIAALTVGLPMGNVVINEIMYGPSGSEPEWVELYNTTSTDVNLKNWKISNHTTTKHTLSSMDAILRPASYAVITKDASILDLHPSISPLLLFAPSLPTALFSNSGDAVVLYDARLVVMDSLAYTRAWGGLDGRSLERIDFGALSTDSTNWGTSNDMEGSTPGRPNSIATLTNDLRIVRIQAPESTTLALGKDASRSLVATIQNVGKEPASGYSVLFYHDANRDSVPEQSELIGMVTPSRSLQRRDTLLVPLTWKEMPAGLVRIMAVVNYGKDERLSNNTASLEIKIGSSPRAAIINEIMFEPLTGQAEWVEVYNPNAFSVDVSEWTLSDMRDASGKANVFSIARSPIQIEPGGYAVISSDSTILSQFPSLQTAQGNPRVIILNRSGLSLNNEGDDIILTDLVGTIIDSLRYSASWHNPDITDVTGISLERINPGLPSTDRRNWSSCVEKVGGTPGHQNSIFTVSIPTQTTLSVSPNPFSPDGDGFEDFTVISYRVSSRVARIRLKIFDSIGRPVRTLANYEPSASTGQIIWDGLDDDKRRLRMGIYIVLLEAIDSSGGTIESAKAAAVVAGRL